MPTIVVKSGPGAGQRIEIEREVVIGREAADVIIEDAELSRRHVVVRLAEGALELEDLGSTNGTYVDGQRIGAPTRVGNGANVKIGQTTLEVEGIVSAPATPAAPVPDVDVTRARAIPDVEATRARAIPDVEATRARAIPDVEATRARAIPDVEATRARAIPDVEATRARAIPDVDATRARAIPDVDATRARAIPDVDKTRARAAPSEPPPAAQPAVAGAGSAAAGSAALPAGIGTFAPPARRRARGLASRSWLPVALSYGTVILTAIALVVYFASR